MAKKSGFKVLWGGFDRLVDRALDRMHRTDEALDALGELVRSQSLRNFQLEQAPDGTKWKKSLRAMTQGGKTLQKEGMRGGLMASITYKRALDGKSVYIGSNKPYAAIHQFGGKAGRNRSADIPARPYIGLNKEIIDEANEIIEDFIKENFSL